RAEGQDGRMSDAEHLLSSAAIADAGLADWTHRDERLTAVFATKRFAVGLELVNRIGEAAEAAGHHPDIALSYPEVRVALSSHDVGGITSRDIELARSISERAAA